MKEMFLIALAFIAIDIVSGLTAAAINKEVSSSIMRQGLYHKIAEIILMGLGVACQYAVSLTELGGIVPDAIFQSVIVYVVAMELISILENINKANPQLKLNALLTLFGRQETDKEE